MEKTHKLKTERLRLQRDVDSGQKTIKEKEGEVESSAGEQTRWTKSFKSRTRCYNRRTTTYRCATNI
jgi:hypothetical protein